MQNQTLEGFRLSPQQKHLWLLQQNSVADRAQCAMKLEGRLQIEILKQALEKIVNRHEILRTMFPKRSGLKVPIQVINNSSKPLWQTFDLSNIDARQQQAKIEKLFLEDRNFPFDLERGSLLRVSLLILSDEQHMLLITLPSLCADSWTLKNLVKEIAYTYGKCLNNEELYDEPVQYLQFSEWQNELLEDENAEAGRDYWHKLCFEAPPLLIPFEKQFSGKTTFEPNVLSLTIEPAVVAKLEKRAKLSNIKISEFLFACWQTLIWRLTRQPNIVINTIFSGRQYEELHETLGLLAKCLPVCCDFQNDFKLNEILTKISQLLHDYDRWHKYFIWEENTETTNIVNFPIAFEFQEWPNKYDVDGVSFSVEKQYVCFERFKIKLTCVYKDEFLKAEFHYVPEIINLENIQYLGKQFKTLLENAVNNPEVEVSKLNILSNCERQKLLFDFNKTRIDFSLDKCIHQLFEEQVEKTPDDIAVIFENQQLTYAELNARANQLARYLQKLGVKKEVLVGIYLERSPFIIISLLGILKAGGAYLPLDSTLPTSGLDVRLQDAGVKILLTQEQLVKNIPESETKVVCLERDWDIIANEASNNPNCEVTPENLVYVLYTSGSTGKPKGVAIEHRQLLNYLYGIQKILNLAPGNSFALVSTFAADLGNTVIFPALCTGGCLHVISFERASNSQALANYFQEHPIDFLKIVPTQLKALLLFEHPAKILPRRQLILGGEATNWKFIEQIQQLAPECQIINHYGPTETTVGVLTYQVERVPDTRQSSTVLSTVPIGRPLANTQIYILDSEKQPTPISVPGEVYIGGASLARGYLNHPELTAEKFILNPFNDDPQARLYKTGDLARYLPDGNIEFLGRIDHQVKIRGFRIEPEEIETVLSTYPHIKQAVVITTEDTPDDKRLVAYVVSDNKNLSTHQLREFLQQQLPTYMVPAAFVILNTLPLTPNGKIDRFALPAPEAESARTEEYVAPRTPGEEIIVHIFGDLLRIETVSIHDSFFELGGHSLLATQLISRLRQSFEVEIPLKAVFEAPSVAQLDQTITQLRTQRQSLNMPTIKRIAPNIEKIPLSFAQERLWFLNQLQGASATYNTPAALRLLGALNLNALRQALAEIIRRHEVLRTSFADINGTPMQVIHSEASINMEVVDLQHLEKSEQELVVEQKIQQSAITPFDLESAPLIRFSLLRLSDTNYVFCINMHHIVSDGWSVGVLVRELSALYKAFCAGESSPLPNLEIQYADFALWQRQWLSEEVLEKQMQYWMSQLQGAPELLQLPTDRRRPTVQTFRGTRQSIALPKTLTEDIKVLSRREGATLFMTLVAAFKSMLHYYSGQNDIVIGTDVANRNRVETEEIIGFFVNQLVLRTDLSGNPAFRELLGRVRKIALEAYDHQNMPFDKLVAALNPERHLNHAPLFQAKFVLQNTPMPDLEIEKLTISLLEVDNNTAKFDLLLTMWETEEGLSGELEYSTDLFNAATIVQMLETFETILHTGILQPSIKLNDLIKILEEAEEQKRVVKQKEFREFRRSKIKNLKP